MVSLATVLVVIRSDDAPIVTQSQSLGDDFTANLKASWTAGLRHLMDTATWLIRVAVGGLVWWLLLGVAIFLVRAAWKRRQRALAMEPAPRL